MSKKFSIFRFLLLALALAGLPGCVTQEKPRTQKFTFFPPAPDTPRIQFLTSFASQADLGRKGGFQEFILGEPVKVDPLVKPYGLAVHHGQVFVCDTVSYVIQVFDFKSRQCFNFVPMGEGKIRLPINITIDRNGTRYVADSGRAQVLVYDYDGNFIEALGKKGEMKPTDVTLGVDRFYVTDLANHCVKAYSKVDRKLLFSIPRDDKNPKAKMLSPTNLAVDETNGRLLVSDTGGNQIQIYDLDGNYIRSIGRAGVAPGMFARPKGVAVDKHGYVYVVDAATQVVQIFDEDGHLLLFFGQPGASNQGELVLPAAVKVDYDSVPLFQKYVAPGQECEYLIYVTSQFGSQKISVYGFLKQK
jgi:DNA-binding beta-propeller fold protein YncE